MSDSIAVDTARLPLLLGELRLPTFSKSKSLASADDAPVDMWKTPLRCPHVHRRSSRHWLRRLALSLHSVTSRDTMEAPGIVKLPPNLGRRRTAQQRRQTIPCKTDNPATQHLSRGVSYVIFPTEPLC